jgi:hypothetical protein
MLNDATIKVLAERAGVNYSTLLSAIKATEEKEIEIEGSGSFLTTDELTAIEERGKKNGYKDGKTAATEMLIKEIRDEEGLTFEGKTKDNLLKSLKEKYQAEGGKEPTKAIDDLKKDKEKLQSLIDEKDKEVQKLKSEIDDIFVESTVKTKLPDKLENGLSRDDLYTLYLANRKINKTENGVELIDKKTNETIKDKKLNPISIDDDIKSYLERFGVTHEQGRGEKDNVPKPHNNIESFKKRSEVEEYLIKNNIDFSEHAGIYAKVMKNDGFDMNA